MVISDLFYLDLLLKTATSVSADFKHFKLLSRLSVNIKSMFSFPDWLARVQSNFGLTFC